VTIRDDEQGALEVRAVLLDGDDLVQVGPVLDHAVEVLVEQGLVEPAVRASVQVDAPGHQDVPWGIPVLDLWGSRFLDLIVFSLVSVLG
jgi:hypothetical protein